MKKSLLRSYIYAAGIATLLTALAACSRDNGSTSTNTSGDPTSAPSPYATSDVEKLRINAATADFSDIAGMVNTPICWGIGKNRDSNNRPCDAVLADEKFRSLGADFIGGEEERVIYLTFDEGYENGFTPSILDTLKEKGVAATFFVTYDFCRNEPELVARMINEGHTVGNHSYSHPSFPSCSAGEVADEITRLGNYVEENFDYEMTLVRFPKGEFSERSLAVAQRLGYRSVFWSFAYMDWNPDSQPSPQEAFEKITASTHNGEIVLLHAVSSANAACLGEVIDYWVGEGYRLAIPEGE